MPKDQEIKKGEPNENFVRLSRLNVGFGPNLKNHELIDQNTQCSSHYQNSGNNFEVKGKADGSVDLILKGGQNVEGCFRQVF